MPHNVVTIRLPRQCWQLLVDPHTPVAIPAEIRILLQRASRVFVVRPRPHREYVLEMLQLHAWHLETILASARLAPDDPRHLAREQCLAAIDDGIRRSRTTN